MEKKLPFLIYCNSNEQQNNESDWIGYQKLSGRGCLFFVVLSVSLVIDSIHQIYLNHNHLKWYKSITFKNYYTKNWLLPNFQGCNVCVCSCGPDVVSVCISVSWCVCMCVCVSVLIDAG